MWELDYAVFAAELGQYKENAERILVDKFFDKSICKIAIVEEDRIVGMIAAHWQAPYSAAQRFGVELEK